MQRRHCVSTADNIVQKVDSDDDGPARKRRKLSALIEASSVAERLTYAGHNEPRPCNSRQSAALPPRQSDAPPPYQSVSLPPYQPASLPTIPQSQSSTHAARTSQHSLRTRRSSPALLRHVSSSGADVTRLHADTHHHADTRHMSTSRPLLTRSRSDMSRDSLRSTLDGVTVDNSHLPSTTSQHHHHHHPHPRPHHDAAAYLLSSRESNTLLTTPPVYPAVLPTTPPTYLPLPLSAPLTPADLACYVAVPSGPVSNPYLAAAMRPSAPSWPTQSGISVVPAAMLAADVLPQYYYGLGHDGLAGAVGYGQAALSGSVPVVQPHLSHPQHHHPHPHPQHQQQQQQPARRRPSQALFAPRDSVADDTSYDDRHQNVSSSYHMTHLPRDLTQIRHAQLPLYPGVESASNSAAVSRQHLADLEALTRHAADARDWSTWTRSSERAQPLFVHHFLSMLESTLGAAHDSVPHLSYTSPHFHNYEALLGLARQLSESKPRGMSKADIDRLASFQFTSAAPSRLSDDSAVKQSSDEGAVTQTSCVVCMSEFVNRQRIRELPCQHIFHLKCIDKWLKTNRTCPLCRADVINLLNSDSKQFIR